MKQKDSMIRQETEADYTAVERLTREAFWNVYRPGCTEHYVVHVLRRDPDFVPELNLVMERDGQIIGHVLYMRARIVADDGREIPMMTFGPISMRPDFQRQGLGKHLLDYSMEMARELGVGVLCIEGNIDFYGKSGFVVAGFSSCVAGAPRHPLSRGAGAGDRSLCSAQGTPARLSGRHYRRLPHAEGLLCRRGCGGGI